MSGSVRPHRRQPTRLLRPRNSPGKNTGVGCHFLLQCRKWKVKVRSLSRVRLFATPWTEAYQAPPSMGFSSQEYWSGVPLLLRAMSAKKKKMNIKVITFWNKQYFPDFTDKETGLSEWNTIKPKNTLNVYILFLVGPQCIHMMWHSKDIKGCTEKVSFPPDSSFLEAIRAGSPSNWIHT